MERIFEPEVGGFPSEKNPFLFNGDMVDRGPMSFEIVIVLLAMKLASPNAVHILRGNHETTECNERYGFGSEMLRKYDVFILDSFRSLFRGIAVCTVI
jgi:hypothetical protein